MGKRSFILAAASVWLSVLSMSGTSAYGQSRPAPAADPAATSSAAPQIQSPYWNRVPEYAHSDVRQSPATPDDILNQTIMAVPATRVQTVVANAQFRRIDRNLNRSADVVRRDFLESDDYAKAVEDLRVAQAEYDRARNEAVAGLKETEEYRSTMAMSGDVADQIAAERDAGNPDPQRLLALAGLKMDYLAPLRSVEREQIEASDAVKSARERVRTAAAEVDRLERGFYRDARSNQTLADLREAREDAKINKLAAHALWYETRIARNIALDYAYTARMLDYERNRYGYSSFADSVCDGVGGYRYGGIGFGYRYPTYGGINYFTGR